MQRPERRKESAPADPDTLPGPIDPPQASWLSVIGLVVLGRAPHTPFVTLMTLVPTAFYLGWAALYLLVEVPFGLMTQTHAQWLVAACVCGASFYLWARCGIVSKPRVPAFTIIQIVFGVAGAVGDYLFIPSMRTASLHLVTLGMVFGFISLSPAQIRVLGVCSSAALLALLAALWTTGSYGFVPTTDNVLPVLMVSISLLALTLIAAQHARLRLQIRQQTRQLRTTLAALEWQATHDALTMLLNRRTMERELQQRAEQASGAPARWSVALIDLDHFKQINDRHGHAAGDEALGAFARLAASQLRAADLLARWGGEEFLVLLDGAVATDGVAAIERLRRAFGAIPICAGLPDLRASFSAGIATHRAGCTVAATIAAADAALYASKAAGRNRCTVADSGAATDELASLQATLN